MKKKIGFHKKPQGIFTDEYINHIKASIQEHIDCDLIEVDFRNSVIINDQVFVGDTCLNDLDVYFWHDSVRPQNWQSDNYHLHALSLIEKNVSVINTSRSTRITNDKFLAHTTLKQAQLPVGDFALVRIDDTDGIHRIFNEFDEDVLLKPRFGGWGIGIARAKSIDDIISITEYMLSFSNNPHQSLLIEKYYKNDLSKWVSVVVIGDSVVFGYKKPLIGDADWKIYDPKKQDGKGEASQYVDPSQEIKDIALAAKHAIGKDIIGFDLIFTDTGYKIIDENGRPGLYKNCIDPSRIDISKEITKLIQSKL